jgi:hypothetical protein
MPGPPSQVMVANDVSERAFQTERGGQWSKGKSAETFNPVGPWLVTPDEIGEVLNLRMWLDMSGVRRQEGSTSTMIFDPYFHRSLSQPVPGARTRRPDQHRYAVRRWHGFPAASLAAGR